MINREKKTNRSLDSASLTTFHRSGRRGGPRLIEIRCSIVLGHVIVIRCLPNSSPSSSLRSNMRWIQINQLPYQLSLVCRSCQIECVARESDRQKWKVARHPCEQVT